MIYLYVFLTALMLVIAAINVKGAFVTSNGDRVSFVICAALYFTVAFYDGAGIVAKISAGWTP